MDWFGLKAGQQTFSDPLVPISSNCDLGKISEPQAFTLCSTVAFTVAFGVLGEHVDGRSPFRHNSFAAKAVIQTDDL